MLEITNNELESLFGQEVPTGVYVGISSNSNAVTPNSIFIARKGETTDGHLFVEEALAKGASLVISERPVAGNNILVENSDKALGDIARFWRGKLSCPVFAITGSNGKTTTKDMLAHLLKVHIGEGNYSKASFNNHTGLPYSILETKRTAKWLVLEAGMNHEGELDYLGDIARPDYAALLNVGMAHREFFRDARHVAKAKFELLHHAKKGALFYGDQQILVEGAKELKCQTYTFGEYGTTYLLNGDDVIYPDGKRSKIEFGLYGKHNYLNATACASLMDLAFGEKLTAQSFVGFSGSAQRFSVEKLSEDLTLVDDSYNANPNSLRAGLDTLRSINMDQPTLFVLGDMNELGDAAEEEHIKAAEYLGKFGKARLVAVGKYSSVLKDNASVAESFACNSADEATRVVDEQLKHVRWVYIKGSRSVGLERISNHIRSALQSG